MNNFVFQNATKIIFGKETEKTVGDETKAFSSKVLLAHYGDEYIKKSGILKSVTDSLTAAKVEYVELTDIKPNPLLSDVNRGIKICREQKIEFILALGGGSVIDTVKTIAAGVYYNGDVWDLFTGKGKVDTALGMGVVLTIPARAISGTSRNWANRTC